MKIEVGSFTPNIVGNTVFLIDSTLQIKGMIFQVTKNGANVNSSEGFSDSIKHRALSVLYDTVKDSARSTSAAILHKKLSGGVAVTDLAGAPVSGGFATAGQFAMGWTTVDGTFSVDFIAIGD